MQCIRAPHHAADSYGCTHAGLVSQLAGGRFMIFSFLLRCLFNKISRVLSARSISFSRRIGVPGKWRISDDVLETFIRQYFEGQNTKKFFFMAGRVD
jgi:hypothetical protein